MNGNSLRLQLDAEQQSRPQCLSELGRFFMKENIEEIRPTTFVVSSITLIKISIIKSTSFIVRLGRITRLPVSLLLEAEPSTVMAEPLIVSWFSCYMTRLIFYKNARSTIGFFRWCISVKTYKNCQRSASGFMAGTRPIRFCVRPDYKYIRRNQKRRIKISSSLIMDLTPN